MDYDLIDDKFVFFAMTALKYVLKNDHNATHEDKEEIRKIIDIISPLCWHDISHYPLLWDKILYSIEQLTNDYNDELIPVIDKINDMINDLKSWKEDS